MSSGTFYINQNAADVFATNSSMAHNTFFYTTTDWEISEIGIAVRKIDTGDASIHILLYVDGVLVSNRHYDVTSLSKHYVRVTDRISVPAYSVLQILIGGYVNSTRYYGSTYAVFAGGCTGQNANGAADPNCPDMYLTLTAQTQMTTDGENEGYPHSPQIEISEWTGFAKDENGYPQNWNVLKFDDNNEGYPWIADPDDWLAKGDLIRILSGEWRKGTAFIFDGEQKFFSYAKIVEKEVEENANN